MTFYCCATKIWRDCYFRQGGGKYRECDLCYGVDDDGMTKKRNGSFLCPPHWLEDAGRDGSRCLCASCAACSQTAAACSQTSAACSQTATACSQTATACSQAATACSQTSTAYPDCDGRSQTAAPRTARALSETTAPMAQTAAPMASGTLASSDPGTATCSRVGPRIAASVARRTRPHGSTSGKCHRRPPEATSSRANASGLIFLKYELHGFG